jgi:hypothetical protein
MFRGMVRITVTMDDRLAEAVRTTAGDNVSGWLAKLVHTELLRRAVDAEDVT